MKVKVLVLSERPNEYMSQKKGLVKERILVLFDPERYLGKQVPGTFDYVLSPAEEAAIPVDVLTGKTIEMGVDGWEQWNGRPRFRGSLPAPVDLGIGAPVAASASVGAVKGK